MATYSIIYHGSVSPLNIYLIKWYRPIWPNVTWKELSVVSGPLLYPPGTANEPCLLWTTCTQQWNSDIRKPAMTDHPTHPPHPWDCRTHQHPHPTPTLSLWYGHHIFWTPDIAEDISTHISPPQDISINTPPPTLSLEYGHHFFWTPQTLPKTQETSTSFILLFGN